MHAKIDANACAWCSGEKESNQKRNASPSGDGVGRNGDESWDGGDGKTEVVKADVQGWREAAQRVRIPRSEGEKQRFRIHPFERNLWRVEDRGRG